MARSKTPQNATENDVRTLSPAQTLALLALVAGQSVSQAAVAAGVERTTIHRWLSKDPLFAAEFNAARLELAESVQSGIRQLADDAIAALRDLMRPNTPAKIRLQVVEMVLARAAERCGSPLPDEIQEEIERRELEKKMDITLWR